jgi:hypothetical protein
MSIVQPAAAPDTPPEEGVDGDFMADVRAMARFNLGPQMRRALGLQVRLRERARRFEAYLNSRDTGGTLLIAAAVDQILRSAQPGGSWFGTDDVPHVDDLRDELISLFGNHDGVARKDGVLDKFRLERARVESQAGALVRYLESPPFLAEFNNAHASPVLDDVPFYDPVAQLYFANLFSLYLTDTAVGMAFLKRSLEFQAPVAATQPPANLPVYHTARFHAFFRLEPARDDLTFDNYDPGTGTFNLDTIGLLKGLGEGVAGAYLSYHAPVMAALVQMMEWPTAEQAWANRTSYVMLQMLGIEVLDDGARTMDVVAYWAYVAEHGPTVATRLRQAAPVIAMPAVAILALVGTWVGAQKYLAEPDQAKKLTHLLEATKEVAALGGAVAESVHAARQRLGRTVFSATLASAARQLNLVSAASDVVMNSHQFMRDLYFNTDQAPATVIKLAGSTIGLMAIGWSVATGASLAGPVGVAAAVLVMAMVLTGTILEAYLADTYLEKFLNRGFFGTDRGHTEDPSQFHYRFHSVEMQLSAYLRLLLGVRMSARAWTVEVGGVEHTRYLVDLLSEHPLPAGTPIRLSQAGVRNPAIPQVDLKVRGPRSGQWDDGVTEVWRDAAPWTGEYVCKGLHYNREQPVHGDHVGRYLTAEITLADEASRVVLQSLISAATGTPIHQIPLSRALKVHVTTRLEPIDD